MSRPLSYATASLRSQRITGRTPPSQKRRLVFKRHQTDGGFNSHSLKSEARAVYDQTRAEDARLRTQKLLIRG